LSRNSLPAMKSFIALITIVCMIASLIARG
jgi:hypothetical protein